jgi:hypothetical protein
VPSGISAVAAAVAEALVGPLPRRNLLAFGTSTEVGPRAHSPLRADIRAAVKFANALGAVGASPAVANSAKPGPMPGQRPAPMAARLPSCTVASSPRQWWSRGLGKSDPGAERDARAGSGCAQLPAFDHVDE